MKKFFLAILIILSIITCFLIGKYFWVRQYVKGSFDSYINIQRIPKSKIKRNKIYFNWINFLTWEDHITIESKGKEYDYVYSMVYGSLPIDLTIYKHNGRANISPKGLEYPPLKTYNE